jgi:hypothetical protein
MLPVIVPVALFACIFGVPAYFIKRWYDYRELKLKSQTDQLELERLRADHLLLTTRLEQLEDTVHDADYELNSKLAKLELKDRNPQ